MILVSGCLVGKNCKYQGGNNFNQKVMDFLIGQQYLAICPEVEGGLSVPREPVELLGGDGQSFWAGSAQAITPSGQDCSPQFAAGATQILDLCHKYSIKYAILKESSPSCGSHKLYDGSFSGTKIIGQGICAALLAKNGIEIISEEQL